MYASGCPNCDHQYETTQEYQIESSECEQCGIEGCMYCIVGGVCCHCVEEPDDTIIKRG